MGKILKNLGRHKLAVFGIFLLLIVQAYCDLSLPQYMSDIVDIGIQQSGIAYAVPEEMRKDTMENLCLFLSEQDAKKLRDSYQELSNGNYELKLQRNVELEELERILGMPLVVMSSMTEETGMDMETLRTMLDSGQITKEQILETEEQAKKQMGDMSESIISQKARLMVREEYEALGYHMEDYQNRYMLRTGGKMLAMTVVMTLASIVAGLQRWVGTFEERYLRRWLHFPIMRLSSFPRPH